MSNLMQPTHYLILFALAKSPAHGAGIREQIVGDTLGVHVPDATLYPALQSLKRRGLIEGGGDRLQAYQLTDEGCRTLKTELAMHRRLVELGGRRLG